MEMQRPLPERVLMLLGIFVIAFVLPRPYRSLVVLLAGLTLTIAAPLYEIRSANPSRLRAAAALLFGSGFVCGNLGRLLRDSRPAFDALDILGFVLLCAAGIVALVKYVRFPELSA